MNTVGVVVFPYLIVRQIYCGVVGPLSHPSLEFRKLTELKNESQTIK